MANGNQTESLANSKTNISRSRSASYPRYSLQQAEELAKAIFDEGVKNCDVDSIARKLKYSNAQNGAFVALRAAANQFGLIEYNKGYISVAEEWIQAFHAEDAELFRITRLKAMYQPTLYKQLLEDFAGRQLPNSEKLKRELYINPKYGILRDASDLATQTFLDSAKHASLIDTKGFLLSEETESSNKLDTAVVNTRQQSSMATEPVRTVLPTDTGQKLTALSNDPNLEGLDRIEIHLINGKKALLFVPVPLPYGERDRLKKYIDLFTEEPRPQSDN